MYEWIMIKYTNFVNGTKKYCRIHFKSKWNFFVGWILKRALVDEKMQLICSVFSERWMFKFHQLRKEEKAQTKKRRISISEIVIKTNSKWNHIINVCLNIYTYVWSNTTISHSIINKKWINEWMITFIYYLVMIKITN